MIDGVYTLFVRIPLYRDSNGVYATDPLWQWDLVRHFDYISDLHICCPVENVSEHDVNLVPVVELSDRNVIPLRLDRGWVSVFLNIFPTGTGIFRALSQTQIAHSGAAGWPFPESYYILLFRPFFRFKWVLVVESSFYRIPQYGKATFRQFLSHHINTFLVRRCARNADARIFTTKKYQDLFLGHTENSLIAPVTWVREADLHPVADHSEAKPKARHRSRLIFPSRLVPDKGVQTVLDAIRIGVERQVRTGISMPQIDIMGSGPMADDCRRVSAECPDGLVRFFDPVPYGEEFFSFLRGYDALIMASVQEGGQPRVLYDALSQGLPCIASNTIATREAITDEETGVFFEPGVAKSLADRLIEFAESPDRLHEMGRRALQKAAEHTHEEMHRTRERFLVEVLELPDGIPANQTYTKQNM